MGNNPIDAVNPTVYSSKDCPHIFSHSTSERANIRYCNTCGCLFEEDFLPPAGELHERWYRADELTSLMTGDDSTDEFKRKIWKRIDRLDNSQLAKLISLEETS